jgi:hypothetical protein
MVGSSFGDLMFGLADMMEVFAWFWRSLRRASPWRVPEVAHTRPTLAV